MREAPHFLFIRLISRYTQDSLLAETYLLNEDDFVTTSQKRLSVQFARGHRCYCGRQKVDSRVALRRIPPWRERDWAPLSSEQRLWNGREPYAVVCEANAIWLHELPFLSLSRPERPVAQSRRQTHVPFADANILACLFLSFVAKRVDSTRRIHTIRRCVRDRSSC